MGWFKNMICKIFKIQPAIETSITIQEPLSFQANVLKNQIWYRGDPSELQQFFHAATVDNVSKTRFWSASAGSDIRKIHAGLPKMVINKYRDIIMSDLDKICINNDDEKLIELWEEIAKESDFYKVLRSAIKDALSSGDGAFKISLDPSVSQYPIVEFYTSDKVEFNRNRGRISEIVFFTTYIEGKHEYRLQETYGKGYVTYKLFNEYGNEVPLNSINQTSNLKDTAQTGIKQQFIMAVPLMFFESEKWPGRGEALFESKTDALDWLDEGISQFAQSVRDARTQKYIPEDLLPRDPNTGVIKKGDRFDNNFIAIASDRSEGAKNEINVVTPDILHEAYQAGYASALDLCLMGIISPSTLGIDLKKTDNAESQREKEKTTTYTRGILIDVLNEVIPEVVETILKVNDLNHNKAPGEYDASVQFGEYAAPGFDTTVEVVGKAKTYGVMSTERCVEELYGDTWTKEQKEEEVARIKAENGTVLEEPLIQNNDDLEDIEGTTLNGAQITSMLGVVKSVATGELTRNAAISIITSTLGVSRENAEQFIEQNAKE